MDGWAGYGHRGNSAERSGERQEKRDGVEWKETGGEDVEMLRPQEGDGSV